MKNRRSRKGAEGANKDRVRSKEQSVAEVNEGREILKETGPTSSRISKTRLLKSGEGNQKTESTSETSTRILRSSKHHIDVSPAAYTAHVPMEIVELIIDNVDGGATFLACSLVCREWLARCRYYLFSRISTPAAHCANLLPVLDPSRLTAHSHSKGNGISTLPPAGIFVQSLVITPSAGYLLSSNSSANPFHNVSLAARLLLDSTPNIKELQLIGVTEWALSHFLDPVSKMGKLEDVALVDVRCGSWFEIATSLAHCAPNLKSLRISGLRFRPPANTGDTTKGMQAGCPTASSSPLYFPLLNAMSIEMELQDSPFVMELLEALVEGPSGTLENLEALGLPIHIVSRSQAYLERVKGSLESLTVYCDKFPNVTSEPLFTASHILDLGMLSRLKSFHLSTRDYGFPAPSVLRILVRFLSGFPYSTLTRLRITFHAAIICFSYNADQWKELDDALSLPHLAGLECVELVGNASFAPTVKRGLPNSHLRGILHFPL